MLIRIPRPPSRGLIEATMKPTRLPVDKEIPRPPSRGLIEAGSGFRAHSRLREIPRPPSRGLIEANSIPIALTTSGAQFRDLQVAASLKRSGDQFARNQACQIPRPPSRGLIEAPPAPALSPRRRGIPRPPSRGLIEANMLCLWSPVPTVNSATSKSRPH